jgi:hypothetical protein
MEQVTVTSAKSSALREFLIDAIEFIDGLPFLRPQWWCLDVAIILMFVCF